MPKHTSRSRLKTLSALPVIAAAGIALAACGGGETVENTNTGVPTVATPAQPSDATSETKDDETKDNKPTETTPDSNEGPAREGEATGAEGGRSEGEEKFLAALSDAGVNVEGTEDVLVNTAHRVCADDLITRDAVAGQLAEQQRTTLEFEQITQLIDESARASVCS